MKAKATKAVVNARIEQVLDLRLAGASPQDIVRFGSENDPETGRPWNVSRRQIEKYIRRSDELLAISLETDRTKIINRHLGQRRKLYAHAVEAGDWRTALAILKDEGELQGLYRMELEKQAASHFRQQQDALVNMRQAVLFDDGTRELMALLAERMAGLDFDVPAQLPNGLKELSPEEINTTNGALHDEERNGKSF